MKIERRLIMSRASPEMNASATCGRTGDVPKGYAGAAGESRANAGIVPGLLRPSPMSQQVSFGRHRFEPATGRLWADERELKLTRKAAAVLGQLLERDGVPVVRFCAVKGRGRGAGSALFLRGPRGRADRCAHAHRRVAGRCAELVVP